MLLQKNTEKPVKVIYFTDHLFVLLGIEPQLRKLKLEYGDGIEIEYVWAVCCPTGVTTAGGISKPSDVAQHWDE